MRLYLRECLLHFSYPIVDSNQLLFSPVIIVIVPSIPQRTHHQLSQSLNYVILYQLIALLHRIQEFLLGHQTHSE